ncbi:hypothetical protein PSV08DRAFT_375096 [Bipolaris maydis]|uniref:uncharacterized protein n=1 Tax=Cochliobolus heterostrophus TaxID=5016 RepID=UPI0024DA64E0|nr:hypothetical protein J3E73DRAFT_390195 [Bipolaris maydis]KAJ6265414.1 hypothetical protein PSV08DRAFT_375096 [Bipolaris maydis]KAJ6276507.1 hypothetical protein J3E71DRAFT_365745 [Bipolaris maydis]
MVHPRPKLTRRRGACEECRQKKSLYKDVSNITQSHVMNDSMMPDSSSSDFSSKVVADQVAEDLASPLNTAFSEVFLSQLGSDSAHSFLDFDFPSETIPDTYQTENTEADDQASGLQNQVSCGNSTDGMVTLDWPERGYNENLYQHSAVQYHSLLGTKADSGGATCTLALFSKRIVADKAEVNDPFLFSDLLSPAHSTYRITALFQNADRGSRRQQTVLNKVNLLLSSKHQTCFSSLLRKIDSDREHQSLDIDSLSMGKLIQKQFVNLENQPIDVSDMSLLIVSLAWGALLDPEVSSVSRVALLDAVLETSILLLRQNGSFRQFLALIAILGLAEKTGSDKLYTLILGSISTAASLNLYLEHVLRKLYTSDEQVIQTRRAMWLLYGIDKSYALRWQTFSLVSEGSLPMVNPSESIPGSDVVTIHSSEWLWIRAQYSKICSNILQLRLGAEEEPSKGHSNKAVALSTALEEWYRSTRYKELLKQSTREIIPLSSTMPSEYLLQDCNHLFINTFALCLLAQDILLDPDQDSRKESRALLSIVAGFFARIGIMFPGSSVFEEVSDLVEILTNR